MLLDDAKRACFISTSNKAYDDVINALITAAQADLQTVGIIKAQDTADPLIHQAVITYCCAHFGHPPNYADLKASYDEQKGHLMSTSGYTDWGVSHG